MTLLRQNFRNLLDDEKKRFVYALYTLKNRGVVDKFAQIHSDYFTLGIHRTSHFLPWHREMLYRFERELQKVDSRITIPYWQSPLDTNTSDELFWNNSTFLGQFDSAWNLQRALRSATLPAWEHVVAVEKRDTYDTYWYGQDEGGTDGLEVSIHNPTHAWVEGIMGTGLSPRDPVFYLHHCWIDMLWAMWQRGNPGAPFEPRGPRSGKWALNDPMPAWTDPTRTPNDVLNHRTLGYRYETENYLMPGDELHPYDVQLSPSGNYVFWFSDEGRLWFQHLGVGGVIWQSSGSARAGVKCVMRPDGNLAILDKDNNQTWESGTSGHNGAWLRIEDPDPAKPQDTGHLVIYDSKGNPLSPKPWSVPPPPVGNP